MNIGGPPLTQKKWLVYRKGLQTQYNILKKSIVLIIKRHMVKNVHLHVPAPEAETLRLFLKMRLMIIKISWLIRFSS